MRIRKCSAPDIWVAWLFVYFSGKMLWDQLPYACELLSLVVLAFYAVQFLVAHAAQPVHRMKLIILFVAFSFYVLADAIIQSSVQQILRAVYEYTFYMLMFFAMVWLLPRANVRKALQVFMVWGVVIALLSWVEFVSKAYIISNIVPGETFRATVFTRSFLSHGVMLGIFSVVCMDFFYTQKKVRYLLLGLFCFMSILTTNSRGPLVAFGVALVLQFVLNAYISQKYSYKRFVASILLVVGLLAVAIVMFGSFTTGIETVDKFLNRIRSILDWNGDAGNVGRLVYWNQALELFQSNRLFGIGPSQTGSWGTGAIGVTESGVLKRLCELGLIGFGLYYCFVGSVLCRGICTYRKQHDRGKQQMTLWLALMLAMLINDCTLQSTEEIMVAFFMWTAFAGIETIADRPEARKLPVEEGCF